jgi:hypothetical protein
MVFVIKIVCVFQEVHKIFISFFFNTTSKNSKKKESSSTIINSFKIKTIFIAFLHNC